MPPSKLTYAQALVAPPPPPPPPPAAPKAKFFDFMKLPQELKDKIYGYYFTSREVTITFNRYYTGRGKRRRRELNIVESPWSKPSLLLVNKDISQDVVSFCANMPNKLTIPHDKDKGLNALHLVCTLRRRFQTLRANVQELTLGGYDGRSRGYGLGDAFELVAAHLPSIKKVTVPYNAMRQVFEGYDDPTYTYEYQCLDVERFRAGGDDDNLVYPVDLLDLKEMAAILENSGRGDVEVYLSSGVDWNAKGRGIYHWQVRSLTLLRSQVLLIRIVGDRLSSHF